MPVTVKPSGHAASPWGRNPFYSYPQASSPEHLLQCTVTDDAGAHNRSRGSGYTPSRGPGLLQSSFSGLSRDDGVFAAKNGFVHACIEAYNMHHHLVLRPEDVWLAILTQLGSYVNANSAHLKHLFFDNGPRQEGQHDEESNHLHIEVAIDDKTDHGAMAFQMAKLLSTRLRDHSLKDWVMPTFSTTTKVDQAVAAVCLLGTMQRYFTYSWGTRCGLPSVTLLGTADDWALIRERCAQRIATGGFGKAAADWWRVLQPVLDGFVESFRDPEGESTGKFWRGICDEHKPNGSGTTTYSGWITAFCYWDEKGKCLHKSINPAGSISSVRLSRSEVPMGFSKVPVTLLENGTPVRTEMVAGSIGIKVSNTAEPSDNTGQRATATTSSSHRRVLNTVQAESGWFIHRV